MCTKDILMQQDAYIQYYKQTGLNFEQLNQSIMPNTNETQAWDPSHFSDTVHNISVHNIHIVD
jgi:hypothetical protein